MLQLRLAGLRAPFSGPLLLIGHPDSANGLVTGLIAHGGAEQLQGTAAIDQRMMDPDHDGDVVVLDAVDDIALPHGLVTVQQRGVEERDQFVKLWQGTGRRHCQVPDMVVQVRLHGLPGCHILAQPLKLLVERGGHLTVAKGVQHFFDEALLLPGGYLEHLVRGHMHLAAAVFQQQESHIQWF